jgi:GNAT superfamily N-acetyltransferase
MEKEGSTTVDDAARLGFNEEGVVIGGLNCCLLRSVSPGCMCFTLASGHRSIGTASADQVYAGRWWISRCLVDEAHRGRGLGGYLVNLLKEEARRQPGFVRIEVAPGGYNSNPKRVKAFYVRCGFVPEVDNEGLFIWEPA